MKDRVGFCEIWVSGILAPSTVSSVLVVLLSLCLCPLSTMLSRRSTLISRRCLSGIVPILGDAARLKHRLPLAKTVATIGPVSEHIISFKQVCLSLRIVFVLVEWEGCDTL